MKMMMIMIMIVQTVTILSSQTTAARVVEGDIAALNGHLHIIDGVSTDLVTVSPLMTLTKVTSQTGETSVTDIYTKCIRPRKRAQRFRQFCFLWGCGRKEDK